MKLFCQSKQFQFQVPHSFEKSTKIIWLSSFGLIEETMDPSRILLALAGSSPQYLCQMILVRYSAMCRSMLHSVGRSSANIIIVMILPHSSSFTSVQWQAQNSRSN